MDSGRRKLDFRMIVTATALIFVSSSVAQKNSFARPRTPLLDKASKVLFGEWKNRTCSADSETGKIYYPSNSFEMSVHHFKDAFAIECSEEKTAIVKGKEVILINEGAVPKASPYAKLFSDVYGADENTVIDYKVIKNKPDEVNLASTILCDDIFVLGKNTKTGGFFLDKINLKYENPDTYELGKMFDGNVDLIAYKGLVFMGGEAQKGKNFLFVFKPDEKLKIFPFAAKSKMKGSVKFWIEYITSSEGVKPSSLMLEIGKNKIRIDVDESKNLPQNIKFSK